MKFVKLFFLKRKAREIKEQLDSLSYTKWEVGKYGTNEEIARVVILDRQTEVEYFKCIEEIKVLKILGGING